MKQSMRTLTIHKRKISLLLLIVFVVNLTFPYVTYAVTNGPQQPEFSSFEPVTTTGMVNEFSGDFTYNIPLIEVPGPHGSSFPFSLSYHSGSNQDEDASWVGYGWSLNPGSITRNVRGNPDDDNGVPVIRHSNEPANKTYTARLEASPEVISAKIPTTIGGFVRYNTYKGWSVGASFDIGFAGYASLGFQVDDGHTNFSGSINPVAILQTAFEDAKNNQEATLKKEEGKQEEKSTKSDSEKSPNTEQVEGKKEGGNTGSFLMSAATYYVKYLLNLPGLPQSVSGYSGENISIRTGVTGSIPTFLGPLGGSAAITGSYSSYVPEADRKLKSYGYLYSPDYAPGRSLSMDYYKERYAPHEESKKYLPIPISNPDYFSVSGEGVGGGFRYHLGKIGVYRTDGMNGGRTNSDNGIEATIGGNIEIGVKLSIGRQESAINNGAVSSLPNAKFSNLLKVYRSKNSTSTKSTEHSVFPTFSNDLGGSIIYDNEDYRRTPSWDWHSQGSKSASYALTGGSSPSTNAKRSSLVEFNRIGDMRGNTAQNRLRCYTRDTKTRDLYIAEQTVSVSDLSKPDGDPLKQTALNYLSDDAIGEYAVHTDNGKCYVYGLPVLARKEYKRSYRSQETFWPWIDTRNTPISSGTTREAPYATSYLLTQILSPDYIDVTGDGPTNDDIGGWIKFNYRRSVVDYGGASEANALKEENSWYKWRMPYDGFIGENNRISILEDNTASYSEGEKQIYYLESIETKSHAAYFVTNKADLKYDNKFLTKGSQQERADAYEKYQSITHKNNILSAALVGPWIQSGTQPTNPPTPPLSPTHPRIPLRAADISYVSGGEQRAAMGMYQLSTASYIPNFQQYLERIELYKKSELDAAPDLSKVKSLKTVRLQYDYEAYGLGPAGIDLQECKKIVDALPHKGAELQSWQNCYPVHHRNKDKVWYYKLPGGIPNSAVKMTREGVMGEHSTPDLYNFYRMGKLTLRKVWFEFDGIANARLAPYEFSYRYPNTAFADSRLTAKYPLESKIRRWVDNLYSTTEEIQDNSISCLLQYGANLNQKPEYGIKEWTDPWGNNRDEQSQYRAFYNSENYVNQSPILGQGQTAGNILDPAAWQLKVIKLPSGGEIRVQYEKHDYSYVQDRPAMAMVEVKDTQIGDQYILNVEKSLGITSPAEKQIIADRINKVIKDKEKILFKFTVAYSNSIDVNGGKPRYNPEVEEIKGYADIAYADVDNGNVVLHMNNTSGSYPISALVDEYWHTSIAGIGQNKATQNNDLVTVISDMAKSGLGFNISVINKKIFPKNSFFRIPLTKPKIGGGGVRVKRILMYSKTGTNPGSNNNSIFGSEGSSEVLYGKEYIYKTVDSDGTTISSGVATNEPDQLRDENSLVGFMEGYDRKKFFGTAISGENINQMEGPLGETLLPSPSIGYSKVIVKDIHSNSTTGAGLTITDYYTAKDFPFSAGVDNSPINSGFDPIPPVSVPGPNSFSIYKMKYEQGYKFEINNMHGQIKRVGKYQINGTELSTDNMSTYLRNLTEKEYIEYEYFKPGELLPIIKNINEPISYGYNGIEMELATEKTVLNETVIGMHAEVDVGITLAALIPAFTFSLADLGMNSSETSVTTSMTTKIINYPAVLKKTTAYQNGMTVETENIAFSAITGEPVITAVTDEFHGVKLQSGTQLNGTMVKYEIPAALQNDYSNMGQKAENQMQLTWESVTFSAGVPSLAPSITLYTGDLLEFKQGTTYTYGYVSELTPSIKVVDANGNPINGTMEEVITVRSGKTNQLKEKSLVLAFYGVNLSDVKTKSLTNLITTVNASTNSGIINSSATTYSDIWGSSTTGNLFLKGERGKWRAKSSYVYKAPTNNSGPIYGTRGISVGGYVLFNPSSPASQWVRTSTVTKYSQHGEAIEEQDIDNKYTSAIYSHNDILPSMVAYNAQVGQLFFESFEDKTGSSINNTLAHTGKNSSIISASSYTTSKTEDFGAGDYHVMFWTTSASVPTLNGNSMVEISRNGVWKLYKGDITLSSSGQITASNISPNGSIPKLIDDVRVQPVNSKATSYVYDDKTFRLLAQFDDQHFALLYQYNAEGKLIRKIKETERGTKTITETQYNTVMKKQKPAISKRDGAYYSTQPQ